MSRDFLFRTKYGTGSEVVHQLNISSKGLSTSDKTQKVRLLPADPLGQRLCKIFSHGWEFIYTPIPTVGKKPHWLTETKYPIEPRTLWKRWQDASELIGVRFGKETSYGLIDVDVKSPYHPNQDADALDRILAVLEMLGLCRTLIVRSSASGGLHIYLPLSEPVPSYGLALAMKCAFEDQGFQIAQGKLELFPNTKAYKKEGFTSYNAHRLPLQPGSGSYLLNRSGETISDCLERFLNSWDLAAVGNDLEDLRAAIANAQQRSKVIYLPARSQRAEQWRQDDLAIIQQGWTGPGQTNEILKVIARYGRVWEDLGGNDLISYVVESAMSAPGYEQFCNHKHEIHRRAQEWAQAAEEYYTPHCSFPKRTSNFHKRECSLDTSHNVIPFNQCIAEAAQERIRQAISDLESREQLPKGADARAKLLTTEAKCSRRTLYKYKHLWHPDHYQDQRVGTVDITEVSAINSESLELGVEQRKVLSDRNTESCVPTPYIRRWGKGEFHSTCWVSCRLPFTDRYVQLIQSSLGDFQNATLEEETLNTTSYFLLDQDRSDYSSQHDSDGS